MSNGLWLTAISEDKDWNCLSLAYEIRKRKGLCKLNWKTHIARLLSDLVNNYYTLHDLWVCNPEAITLLQFGDRMSSFISYDEKLEYGSVKTRKEMLTGVL